MTTPRHLNALASELSRHTNAIRTSALLQSEPVDNFREVTLRITPIVVSGALEKRATVKIGGRRLHSVLCRRCRQYSVITYSHFRQGRCQCGRATR